MRFGATAGCRKREERLRRVNEAKVKEEQKEEQKKKKIAQKMAQIDEKNDKVRRPGQLLSASAPWWPRDRRSLYDPAHSVWPTRRPRRRPSGRRSWNRRRSWRRRRPARKRFDRDPSVCPSVRPTPVITNTRSFVPPGGREAAAGAAGQDEGRGGGGAAAAGRGSTHPAGEREARCRRRRRSS